MQELRRASRAELAAALQQARATLLACVEDLAESDWRSEPSEPSAGINPIGWEIAHVGWFAELWTQRGPVHTGADGRLHAARPPRHLGPDALLDSARLPHADRWHAALPSPAAIFNALAGQLAATLDALSATAEDDVSLAPFRLALAHEDMHAEALLWHRAARGLAAPAGLTLTPLTAPGAQVRMPAGRYRIGTPVTAAGFAFDNEQPGLELHLDAFTLDATPVTQGEFLAFVEDGGYDSEALWPQAGKHWRRQSNAVHPQRWRKRDGQWEHRWFAQWQPLDLAAPVIHVNAFEAQAYCRWRGRRLPRAAEWEVAALSGQLAWGQGVWEWTSDPFEPYPGFVPGAYRDYSAPWFGSHRELRGGAFCTSARLHDARFRNFFTPERTDVFAGFRTAAIQPGP